MFLIKRDCFDASEKCKDKLLNPREEVQYEQSNARFGQGGFNIPSIKVWLHAFCISHFILKKPSTILLAPVTVTNGYDAFYSVNRGTFARPKEKLCLIVSPFFV